MSFTFIRNGTLIDGNGGQPVANAGILIEDNRIRAVGAASGISLPTDVTEIDAKGGYILPGFIDAHVHVMLEGVNLVRDLQAPFSLRFYNATQYLRRTIEAGITSVRDAGGADAGTREAVASGVVLGPRMQISITVMSITGGHGDGLMLSGNEFELFPSYPGYPAGRVDGVDACRQRVREILRAGADVIKICSTGGVLSPTDHPEFTQFSPEELDVIVREAAYRRGIKVMSHAQGADGIKSALRAGVHSIEHGIYIDDEVIELFLEKGAYLVPTLLAPLAVLEAGEKGGMPDYGVRKAREVVEIHSESISRAHKAGVKIAMGTDAGVMPHGTNLRELGLMVNIGMSPMESIVATTKTAAECLGWQDKVGTLETGKLADVVIARTNPLTDIRSLENTQNIAVVMKDGKVVKDIR
jgi:imidazolonepropionase-like amidohydrolase